MAKLGYTWYPKDWGNSEAVFELTLLERGLYRELIDIAMLNDNKTQINVKTWARKFGSSIDEIESILITLTNLKLIEIDINTLFIPSCESRLVLVRSGAKGGSKSKPTNKGKGKGSSKPTSKGDNNQIEKKRKEKEIEDKRKVIISEVTPPKLPFFFNWLEYRKDIKKEITNNKTLKALVDRLNKESVDKCKWVINHSIENNYQGLFWDKFKGGDKQNSREAQYNSPIL